VSFENEALRAQLFASGIAPAVEWWKAELSGAGHASGNDGHGEEKHGDGGNGGGSGFDAAPALDPEAVWAAVAGWAEGHGHLRAVEVFRAFDKDRSGFIDLGEFKALLLEVCRVCARALARHTGRAGSRVGV